MIPGPLKPMAKSACDCVTVQIRTEGLEISRVRDNVFSFNPKKKDDEKE